MIQIHAFKTLVKGPHLLVFGAIHGNEVCGPKAIQRTIEEIQSGKIKLQKGSVIFVPVCNPRAYAKNVRLIEENLNRVFKKTARPLSYEAQLANVLCPLVDSCDALLDIHSVFGDGDPFIYLDFPTKKNSAWATVLGPKGAVVGWPELYAKQDRAHASFDTTAYAVKNGKDSLLIECGQHGDTASVDVAYRAICNTLKYFGLTNGAVLKNTLNRAKIEQVFFRKKGEVFAKKTWRHLDQVRKGDVLIRAKSHSTLAPADGYIVMPAPQTPVGHDWLYFGRKVR